MESLFNRILLFIIVAVFFSCEPNHENRFIKISGSTMGTTYNIVYRDSLDRNFNQDITTLLKEYNQEVSTYIKTSRISAFNQSEKGIKVSKKTASHFVRNFKLAIKIHQETAGWFNPAVMPLVNYWGFGYTEKKPVVETDSALVDSLKNLANFEDFSITETKQEFFIKKPNAAGQLDFSAIAKGDAVDQIGQLLEQKGIENYMVEIGGELRARGYQQDQLGWLVGINVPKTEAGFNAIQTKVALEQMSLATSGNYRNFHQVNGIKYAHTINPHTGYPEKNRLLSVSIFAEDCASADALATACMGMGLEQAWELIQKLDQVEGYLIYSEEDGSLAVKLTERVQQWLRK